MEDGDENRKKGGVGRDPDSKRVKWPVAVHKIVIMERTIRTTMKIS